MNDYNFTDNKLIRYKIEKDYDPIFGGEYIDYVFEMFKRPYFFGLLGKHKWIETVQTNSFEMGKSFTEYLLNKKL